MPHGRMSRIRGTVLPRPRALPPTSQMMRAELMLAEFQRYHKDFMDGMVLIRQAIDKFNEIKQGNPGTPGAPGKPGKDGNSVTAEQVSAEVRKLFKQPADGKSPTAEEVASVIMQDPKIFRFIKKRLPAAPKDGVTPEVQAVVDEVIKTLRAGVLKIEHIPGLDGKFREVYNQLATKVYGKNTWERGGGDTVAAGTGVNITENAAGQKVISVPGATITPITVSGTIDDSNTAFTAATEPTLLCINGSFYKKTGGSITWSYLAGNITLSSAVGTGGSIFGI